MMRSRVREACGLVALALIATVATTGLQRWSQWRLGAQVAAHAGANDIRMIASVGCVYCAAARVWFNDNRVPFSECLIERDADCARVYQALRAPGTPVMLVRGRRLVGFSPQAIADVLVGAP